VGFKIGNVLKWMPIVGAAYQAKDARDAADRGLAAQTEATALARKYQEEGVTKGNEALIGGKTAATGAITAGRDAALGTLGTRFGQSQAALNSNYTNVSDYTNKSNTNATTLGNSLATQTAALKDGSDAGIGTFGTYNTTGQGQLDTGLTTGSGALTAGQTTADTALNKGGQIYTDAQGNQLSALDTGYSQAINAGQPYLDKGTLGLNAFADSALNADNAIAKRRYEEARIALDKTLASRGLLGTGAAIKAQADLLQKSQDDENLRQVNLQKDLATMGIDQASVQGQLLANQGINKSTTIGTAAANKAQLERDRASNAMTTGVNQSSLAENTAARKASSTQTTGTNIGNAQITTGQNISDATGTNARTVSALNADQYSQEMNARNTIGTALAKSYQDQGLAESDAQTQAARDMATYENQYGVNYGNILTGNAAAQATLSTNQGLNVANNEQNKTNANMWAYEQTQKGIKDVGNFVSSLMDGASKTPSMPKQPEMPKMGGGGSGGSTGGKSGGKGGGSTGGSTGGTVTEDQLEEDANSFDDNGNGESEMESDPAEDINTDIDDAMGGDYASEETDTNIDNYGTDDYGTDDYEWVDSYDFDTGMDWKPQPIGNQKPTFSTGNTTRTKAPQTVTDPIASTTSARYPTSRITGVRPGYEAPVVAPRYYTGNQDMNTTARPSTGATLGGAGTLQVEIIDPYAKRDPMGNTYEQPRYNRRPTFSTRRSQRVTNQTSGAY